MVAVALQQAAGLAAAAMPLQRGGMAAAMRRCKWLLPCRDRHAPLLQVHVATLYAQTEQTPASPVVNPYACHDEGRRPPKTGSTVVRGEVEGTVPYTGSSTPERLQTR
jgi:hypothetical protein